MAGGALGLWDASLGADPVREIIHRCGKTALNLLLITLCVTPIRQLTHWNDVQRFRRMLGLFAFFYAVLHFVAYAWLDQRLDWSAIGEDILKRPYITIGLLALLLLVPLAATSTHAMMRRLKRRWQTLHYLIYPIAILGVWHFWWQVKKDIREPLIYAAILAVLLGWRLWRRVLKPRLTSKSAPATVQGRT
ncbi:MAG: protein-methionine-sulfoxide reductase heme-binding subunit MsrQ [Steroidobacteraceae bacterium]